MSGNNSDIKKSIRFFTKNEVSIHNVEADCWVIVYGNVIDLTGIIAENKGVLTQPLIDAAGTDISHWFDEITRTPITCVDQESGEVVPYVPQGKYLHVDGVDGDAVAWWNDKTLRIGRISESTRTVRIMNTLSQLEHTLEVCNEETLSDISDRYLKCNAHAKSYVWKYLGKPLNMNKTLSGNGIPDQAAEFEDLHMDPKGYIPTLHVYFTDDLTVA